MTTHFHQRDRITGRVAVAIFTERNDGSVRQSMNDRALALLLLVECGPVQESETPEAAQRVASESRAQLVTEPAIEPATTEPSLPTQESFADTRRSQRAK